MGVLCYSLALWDVTFSDAVRLLLASVSTLSGIALIGYLLNDWADIPYDAKVGKSNMVAGVPLYLRMVLFTVFICLAAIPWVVYLPYDKLSITLLIVEFVLLAAYALPPVRFKNFPPLAVVTDALYAYAVPSVLAWHTYTLFVTHEIELEQGLSYHTHIALGVWMFALGLRHIINHHIDDKERDKLSSTPNLANKFAPHTLNKLVRALVYPIELLAAVAFFWLNFGQDNTLGLVALALVFVLGFYGFIVNLLSGGKTSGVYFDSLAIDKFYQLWLALAAAVFMTVADLRFAIFVGFLLLFFSDFLVHPLFKAVLIKLRSTLSLWVNHGIYYFRKWVLRWPDEKNLGKYYDEWQERKKNNKKRKRGTIAIFNAFENKYTETFVKGQMGKMPFKSLFYYGDPYPIYERNYGHLISDNTYLRAFVKFYHLLFNIDFNRYKENRLIRRLQWNGVDLILAHFGPMGTLLTSVSKRSGIPLVVIFHGYDAWHRDTLEAYNDKYKQLFEQASAVVAVSKDIAQQLVKLGCPSEKITYQPAYIDLEAFTPVLERDYKPTFLAVGRFAETKAPHLTILAFNQIAQKHPEAKLVMIGKDGGGLLFEACQQLAKALKLEDRIDFRGVCTHEEVKAAMTEASYFIQHSVTTPILGDKEGTPISVVEAMASGMTVIATRHAGIAEVIEHEKTGILVEEYDWEKMAEWMEILLNDTARSAELGKNAAQYVHNAPIFSDHIDNLAEIIDKHKIK